MSLEKILVVDDSMSSRLVLRKMLQEYNVDVTMVESVKDALDYLSTQSPDVIFLDHLMPGLNGMQALKMLKEDPSTASIPVVMFTAIDDDRYGETIRQQGAVGVLPKPFSDEALFSIMQQVRNIIEQGEPANDSASVATAAPLNLDDDAIQAQLQPIIANIVQQQINPLLEAKFKELKAQTTSLSSNDIQQHVNSTLEATLQQSTQQLAEQLQQRLEKFQQQSEKQFEKELAEQSNQFEQRFSQLENWVANELSEVNKSVANLPSIDNFSDPVVAENSQNVWTEQLADEISEDDLPKPMQPIVEPAAKPPANTKAYGLIAAIVFVLVIIAIIYFLRS